MIFKTNCCMCDIKELLKFIMFVCNDDSLVITKDDIDTMYNILDEVLA